MFVYREGGGEEERENRARYLGTVLSTFTKINSFNPHNPIA